MLRRALIFCLILPWLLVHAKPVAQAGDAAPVPQRMPGGWWVGATPPGCNPDLPVLVFVAGLHQPAASWWSDTRYYGPNDMYAIAYHNGLRTAFVELDANGGHDMWDNGRTLAAALELITAHFGVPHVTLVTHSKGGIDANAAAAFFGAAPRIAGVISLSPPHWGSPLADLAMSGWAGWLASLLGERDAGVRSMQVGYMRLFRQAADRQPDDQDVPYFSASGVNWGPEGSALWLGGAYLSAWGANDGMVSEASTHKAADTHLATLDLDHDAMRTARAWPAVADALSRIRGAAITTRAAGTPRVASGRGPEVARAAQAVPGAVLRGGLAHGQAAVSLPIETGTQRATFYVLTSAPATVRVSGPDGHEVPTQSVAPPAELLHAAHWQVAATPSPAAGDWRVEMNGSGDFGYLVVAEIEDPAAPALRLPSAVLPPGGHAKLDVQLSPALAGAHWQASAVLLSDDEGEGTSSVKSPDATGGPAAGTGAVSAALGSAAELPEAIHFNPVAGVSLALPQQPGVYAVAVTLQGRLADGSRFERSFATSVAVGDA